MLHGIRLVVAYDGAKFAGWQRQPGQRSVQGTLEQVIERLEGRPVNVRGASRTDSGVHAHGQIAAFDATLPIRPHGWVRGLNGKLPPDVAVREATPCDKGYTPRYDALAKTYRYLMHLGAVRDPLLSDRAWHLGPKRAKRHAGPRRRAEDWLDLSAMEEAAEAFIGEHDFRAFQSSRDDRDNTVRTLTRVELIRSFAGRDDVVAIEVRGNAFLQHMMRILVGTLVDVGRGRRAPAEVAALLEPDAGRIHSGETAPTGGLYLVEIELGRIALTQDLRER